MKILLLNNDGGGFADYADAEPGTGIQQFLQQKLPHGSTASTACWMPAATSTWAWT